MSLLGLLRHMTDVERIWFTTRVHGRPNETIYWSDASPDGDSDEIAGADASADYAAYLAECERSQQSVADLPLDHTFLHPRDKTPMSLRWVFVHMIEEYARHNGHADLIRERIDGATGE